MNVTVPWAAPPARLRPLLTCGAIFLVVTLVACCFAPRELWTQHTSANHFALLADAFRAGRLDLNGPPPDYAANNDFALYRGRSFVVFPPVPALLLLPWVLCFGGAERTPDGLFFLLCSGFAPAFLFLALQKLTRRGGNSCSLAENAAYALLFAFGSVYFFSAVQGTVWFAAHIVAAAFACAYLLVAIGAQRPLLAGLLLALGFFTRAPLLFAAPFFLVEAIAKSAPTGAPSPLSDPRGYWRTLQHRQLLSDVAWFSLPLLLALALGAWYNAARFGDPSEVGYRYLTIAWQPRILRWGLFGYHYLPKNLGVLLTSLPWVPGEGGSAFSINLHGLALWFTTPLYLLLLWPLARPRPSAALALTALCVALPSLFYQNTGWAQFGYRFSNDYAPFLFALLALGGRKLRGGMLVLALWCLVVNAFGALSFGRPEYAHYYFVDPTQRILYQP